MQYSAEPKVRRVHSSSAENSSKKSSPSKAKKLRKKATTSKKSPTAGNIHPTADPILRPSDSSDLHRSDGDFPVDGESPEAENEVHFCALLMCLFILGKF